MRDVAVTGVQTCALPIAQGTGGQGRAVWGRSRRGARRAQFVLPPRGRAGGLRAPAETDAPVAQPGQERFVLVRERSSARRVGARRPAQAAHGWNGWSGWRGTQLMSDTFFSGAPHWTWFIIPYFFVGGLAGGAHFLAAVLDWFGRPEDRPVVRTGYDIAAVGGLLGLFIAGYTGILLSVTNRPIWADSPWLGALFVASGVSTGAAALILLSPGRGATERSLGWLSSFDTKALVVELLVLAAFIWSLGPINRVWVSFWGLLLLVGVVGFGILAPLRMHAKPAQAAKLVLLGGFLLRLATMLASEGIDRYRVAAGL